MKLAFVAMFKHPCQRWLFMMLAGLGPWSGAARLSAADDMRVWTDSARRQVEASIIEVKEDQVRLKKRDGRVVSVAMNQLSSADQGYVNHWLDGKVVETIALGVPAVPVTMNAWPDSISSGTEIAVQTIQEDEATKSFIYRTEHFEFRSDARLGVNVVKDIGRLFEAGYTAVKSLPLDLKPVPPAGFFVTQLYEDKERYHQDGGPKGSGGLYVARAQRILVPLESIGVKRVGSRYTIESRDDNQVLIHEITHQLMDRWFYMNLPVWAAEGMAEYMAASKYRMGRFSFVRQADNIAGFLKAGGMVKDRRLAGTLVPVESLMTMKYPQWATKIQRRNYASALLVLHYYAHGDGAGDGAGLHSYLRSLEGGVAEPAARDRFLLRGRTSAQVQEELVRYWKKEGLEITFGAAE